MMVLKIRLETDEWIYEEHETRKRSSPSTKSADMFQVAL